LSGVMAYRQPTMHHTSVLAGITAPIDAQKMQFSTQATSSASQPLISTTQYGEWSSTSSLPALANYYLTHLTKQNWQIEQHPSLDPAADSMHIVGRNGTTQAFITLSRDHTKKRSTISVTIPETIVSQLPLAPLDM
jgi:catalase (peroxidase I)